VEISAFDGGVLMWRERIVFSIVIFLSIWARGAKLDAAQLNRIHSGSVTLPDGNTAITDTLSPAVDTTKSFLVFSLTADNNRPDSVQVTGQITNATTVTFERIGSTGPVTIQWYVAEFLNGVDVQRGSTLLSAAGRADVTAGLAPAVDLAKSFPLISLRTEGGTFDGNDFIRAEITDSSTLSLTAPDGGDPAWIEWQVIEYVDANVRHGNEYMGSGISSVPVDRSPDTWDPNRSWLIYSHEGGGAGADMGQALVRGVITGSSTFTLDRNNTGNDIDLTWYLVEFTDGNSVRHASEPFSSTDTQKDVTLNPRVDKDLSIALAGKYMRGGRSPYSADDNPGVGWFKTELLSNTTLRLDRAITGSTTADVGWFVIQFLQINYRSIGDRADYGTAELEGNGTDLTATAGSAIVTGAGTAWQTANRGRGDVITIDATDYVVYSVDSETQITLNSTFAGTTGAGKSYTIARQFDTIQEWEACATFAVPCTYFPVDSASLVADNRREIGLTYDDSTFQENVSISDPAVTTDSSRYLHLSVAEGNRHDGTAGSGVLLDPNTNGHAVRVEIDYTIVDWLEIYDWQDASSEAVRINADGTLYQYLLVHGGPDTLSTGSGQSDGFYIQANSGNWTATIRNSVIFDVPRAGIHLQNSMSSGSNLVYNLENVTVYNCGSAGTNPTQQSGGISICADGPGTSTINAVNVISVENFDADSSLDADFNDGTEASCNGGAISWGTSDFNVSKDASAPGASSLANRTETDVVNPGTGDWVIFENLTAGSEDLHLVNSVENDAVNSGTDLSANFTTDIDLDTRAGTWDRGADELVIPAATLTLANHSNGGQIGDQFTNTASVNDVLFRFNLTRSGAVTVNTLRVNFTTGGGVDNVDVTNGELWRDNNNDGVIDGLDSEIQGGVTPVGGVLTFTADFSPDTLGTNYLLRATVSNLVALDTTTFSVGAADIDLVEWSVTELGAVTNATHTQDPPPELILADHAAGQVGDKFVGSTPVTETLFQMSLTRVSIVTVDTVRVNFTTGGGVANGDVNNGELWADTNGNGNWDGGPTDTLIQGGVAPVAGVLTFGTNFSPGTSGTIYFVRATVSNLASGDTTTLSVGTADIDVVEGGVTESGSVTAATHTQDAPGACTSTVNYRSIGTNAADLANTGTATVSDGSQLVTFSGVSLPAHIGQGDQLTLDPSGINEVVFVVNRLSDTELVLNHSVSNNHSGVGYHIRRAYSGATAIQDWENARDGDLVGEDRLEVGFAFNDGVFTENVVFSGATTDSCHYMWLMVAVGQRHNGTAGTGVRIDPASADAHAFDVQSHYTRIDGFEVTGWEGSSREGVHIDADNTTYSNMIVHGATDSDSDGFYLEPNSGNWTATIRNTVVYGIPRAGIHLQNYTGTATLAYNLENVTVYNCGGGNASFDGGVSICEVAGSSSTIHAKNVLSVSNTSDDFRTRLGGSFCDGSPSWGTSSHNLSSDTSAPGSDFLHSRAAANQFVDTTASSEDLHLKDGADALEQGVDLATDFTDDIDGEGRPRGAQWDIGADERGVNNTCPISRPAWYDTNWSQRKAISIQSSLVTGNLSNFPVLVSLASDTDLAAEAQTNGEDILFTTSDGVTKLSHEIEDFVKGTGKLVAWVKVPYLSSGVDTTLWMYYGNGSVASQEDGTNVWDTNYRAVWHLNEDPSGASPQAADSTSFGHHASSSGSMDSGDQVPGKIHGSMDFDGIDDHLSVTAAALSITNQITLEAWVNHSSSQVVPFDWAGIVSRKDEVGNSCGYTLQRGSDNAWYHFAEISSGWRTASTGAGTIIDDDFQHVAATYDGTTLRIYQNGSPVGSTTFAGTICDPGTVPLRIGRNNDTGSAAPDYHLTALIDEVRISDVARPQEWIQTEYNNQFNPTAFCRLCNVGTTAVDLLSFVAKGRDQAVDLSWETGSEIDNLGFNLYRSTSMSGPYALLTERPIPGLGSSPEGARYHYSDVGLENGVTYYYRLEDIETTGRTEMHGPVSATAQAGVGDCCEEPTDTDTRYDASAGMVGDPSKNQLDVVRSQPDEVILVLETEGFYAVPQQNGTFRLEIPGFDATKDRGAPSVPVRRTWVDVPWGPKVELVSIEPLDEVAFENLRPSRYGAPVVESTGRGTVRLRRARPRVARPQRSPEPGFEGTYPREAARLGTTGVQGDVKKVLVEMMPLAWNASENRLVWTRRLIVRLRFHGYDGRDRTLGGDRGRRYRRRSSHANPKVVARFVTEERGLHGVSFEEVFARRRRSSIPETGLRLSRQGQTTPFHLEPNTGAFGPGTTLYFWSPGAKANPFGTEVVHELEIGASGSTMPLRPAPPFGESTPRFWETLEREEDTLYQPTLVDAPDRWLWSLLFAPVTKNFPFELRQPVQDVAHLSVWLQGASDFAANPDHHVRLAVNGHFVGESYWNGKEPLRMEAELPPGILIDGENQLEVENVGDTEATYSMVALDRFQLSYPKNPIPQDGVVEGRWKESGTAEIKGLGSRTLLLNLSATGPVWLTGAVNTETGLRFRVEEGETVLAVDADAVSRVEEVRKPPSSRLKHTGHRADYLAIGPREFVRAAVGLLERRREQGLRVQGVDLEQIFSEFGFGEKNPQAIQDFISYAYHHWRVAPRYVVLLGDGTYDFKDHLGTGVVNRVPPMMVRTTYLETASDPAYAAVNGDDLLPDLAVGRLPAATIEELEIMIEKILAWEGGASSFTGKAVLVTDDPDDVGNFVADAESLAATVLSAQPLTKLYLSRMGETATRAAIRDAFDDGSSLMNYVGHGGIHLWADENLLNIHDIEQLSPQPVQPMLLTMNCLNGYFHFPYFNALAEALLKVEGKGVVAAFSPSGMSLNDAAHVFHKAMLEELLSGEHRRLGDVVLAAQVAYAKAGALPEMIVIYHLFGDPAMPIQ
jgi:hypothetical protein